MSSASMSAEQSDRSQSAGGETPAVHGTVTIQQASRLLGVPAPTIRSWERRYGIPEAGRSTGGHRRYSPEQIDIIRRMRDTIARGQAAADAAAMVKAEQLRSFEPLIRRFLEAAHRLQPAGVVAVLDDACTSIGLGRTIDEVMFPAMQQIGREWRVGRCNVAQEHVATDASRVWLSRVPTALSPQRDRRPILLSCGPRDPHTLGLEALDALLRSRGCDSRMLGACIPVHSLYTAISDVRPAAVVLVSHLSVARRTAVESLRVARLGSAELFYAGNAFSTRQARTGVPGTYLGESLSRAVELVVAAVTAAGPVTPTRSRPRPRMAVGFAES